MSKLFSIFISSLILVQSFNIHFDDILKLNELLEHAQMHKKEYGDDFLVFVSKHYGELKESHDEDHQEEQEDHEQLPFNCHCATGSVSIFILNQIASSIVEVGVIDVKTNFLYQESNSLFEKPDIFQPPRQT